MSRSASYQTKQRNAILNYIISMKGAHLTAAQILGHFEKEIFPIGRATVYRHLEKLTVSGRIRRYTIDGVSGACYQYIGDNNNCQTHFHLKCESCGELQHLDCAKLDEIQQHVFDSHNFEVNPLKTVLYGKCSSCLNK